MDSTDIHTTKKLLLAFMYSMWAFLRDKSQKLTDFGHDNHLQKRTRFVVVVGVVTTTEKVATASSKSNYR